MYEMNTYANTVERAMILKELEYVLYIIHRDDEHLLDGLFQHTASRIPLSRVISIPDY